MGGDGRGGSLQEARQLVELRVKVSTRNYIAGYTKRVLRKSRPKGLPKTAEGFPKLCVELQLNVFEYLHPIDLYHLSQVCKSYRRFILDPSIASIWRISFDRHPDLPKTPPGVLESDWSFMLFCPGICTVCGRHGALTDFKFLQRHCDECMRMNYVALDNFYPYRFPKRTWRHEHTEFKLLKRELAELLPYSYRQSGLYYHIGYQPARFLLKDLQLMLKKLKLIQILIKNGLPQLAKLLQEYKSALLAHNKKQQKFTSKAGSWASGIFRKCLKEYNSAQCEVMKRCEARLHNLGYEDLNMDGIASTLGTRMTTKAFRMIRPSLETSAQQQQQIQIEWNCRRLLEHIYDDYAKTLSPEEWECLPPRSHIMEIDTFKQFKDASPFDKRDIHPGYVATFFPSFIEGVQRRQRTRIIELFSNIESKEVKIVVTEDLSELAALVVSCKRHSSNRLLIGWKNVFRHLMRGWNDCTDCKVEPAAIVDAAMVISAAGMDPSKTTASEMDDLDGRFICGNCTPASYRGRQSCEVYTWVECIQHSEDTKIRGDAAHKTPRWVCLTPAASRFIRTHEPPYPPHDCRLWGCNHCAQHYEHKAAWVDVVEHVRRVHCIKVPVKGKDIRVTTADEQRCRLRRSPFRLDMEVKYHCQRCPELPICRLWKLDSLMQHLKQRHRIGEPAEGQDWSTIKMLVE